MNSFSGMICVLICLMVLVNGQISTLQNWNTTAGIQVYLINKSSGFVYADLEGDSSKITVTAHILLPISKSSIESGNGLYVGVGFGSNRMNNQDIILFNYKKGVFTCNDFWSPGDMISSDVSLGGRNDVTYVSGSITELTASFAPYMTELKWTCSKDLTTLDKYDWSNFKTWNTNQGPILSAWNYLDTNGIPLLHTFVSPTNLKIIDGNGSTSSSNSSQSINLSLYVIFSVILLILLF